MTASPPDLAFRDLAGVVDSPRREVARRLLECPPEAVEELPPGDIMASLREEGFAEELGFARWTELTGLMDQVQAAVKLAVAHLRWMPGRRGVAWGHEVAAQYAQIVRESMNKGECGYCDHLGLYRPGLGWWVPGRGAFCTDCWRDLWDTPGDPSWCDACHRDLETPPAATFLFGVPAFVAMQNTVGPRAVAHSPCLVVLGLCQVCAAVGPRASRFLTRATSRLDGSPEPDRRPSPAVVARLDQADAALREALRALHLMSQEIPEDGRRTALALRAVAGRLVAELRRQEYGDDTHCGHINWNVPALAVWSPHRNRGRLVCRGCAMEDYRRRQKTPETEPCALCGASTVGSGHPVAGVIPPEVMELDGRPPICRPAIVLAGRVCAECWAEEDDVVW